MNFLENVRLISEELDQYYRDSASGSPSVVVQLPTHEIIERLNLKVHVERGTLDGSALAEFIRRYLSLTVRLHHPGSLAHQVAVPHQAGALATLVEGFTNNPMAIYEMGPAAASIESFIIDWLLSKVGWPSASSLHAHESGVVGAGGVLTHGGSLANLTALVTARSQFDDTTWAKGCRGDLALIASAGLESLRGSVLGQVNSGRF